jgi:pimeloyl-ACP methyl ester carboxylesterase
MQVFGDMTECTQMRVTNDDAQIDVRIDGRGDDVLVLLAGFPLSREIWDQQVKTLAETHRVVRPDLRGMGASSVVNGPYLMENLAADVAAVLDAIGVERATIVGHSAGGYVALAFARMFTERVKRLALVSSRLRADTPEQAETRRDLADRAERELSIAPVADAFIPRLLAPETPSEQPEIAALVNAIVKKIDPRGAAAMLRGLALRDPADDIAPELTMPVMVVAGGRDAVVPVEEARQMSSAFPQSRFVLCERSGHLPMIEEPDAVTEALAGF